MGDFNGHLQSIDGYQDFNGDLVLKLVQEFSLEIANMRVDCEGDFTYGLIKHLGTIAREHLAIIFTGIIYGDNIPEDWLRGRVCLLLKNGGNPSLLKDHRPLTVTSVLYRVFAKVVKGWVSAWAEASGHLTELQNGFRPRRRLEDNIYVLTQCVDIARKQ
ncbi:uncharacterized protein LOC144157865 [Haemaphysalis longicornis]